LSLENNYIIQIKYKYTKLQNFICNFVFLPACRQAGIHLVFRSNLMKFFSTTLIAGFLVVIITAGSLFFVSKLQSTSELKETPTILNIPKGAGFGEITDELYSKGLIQSKNIFKIYTLLKGNAHRLQNGKYKFSSAVAIPELVNILKIGPKDISVIIYPGMTLKEIDDKLAEEEIIGREDLIKYNVNYANKDANNANNSLISRYPFLQDTISLEGFLLPDTYGFRYGSDVEVVVEKMLDNFQNKAMAVIGIDLAFEKGVDPHTITSLYLNRALAKTDSSAYYLFSGLSVSNSFGVGVDKKNNDVLRLITIASYLEKEVPDSEDRKIVAGIIEKRIKTGMPIQIDATVLYNKCFGRFVGCALLKNSDFKIDSPYNTYLRRGLTPTPISNPGLDAIQAAVKKKESAYWYYISDPKTKKTIFAENLDKHNANRVKYLLK